MASSETPSTGPSPTPPDPPPTPTPTVSTLMSDQWFRRLLYIRQCITNVEKKVATHGEISLTTADFTSLRRALDMAAYHQFDDAGLHYTHSKVGIAVRHLRKPKLYDTQIAETAAKLYERWQKGDFTPGPVFAAEDDDEFSSDAIDSEEEADEVVEGASDLMRGINVTRSRTGMRVYTLDPNYPRRDAAVFGSNGLTVGDWWPYQICALRDGAHGSRMGGIHGRGDGAYSVVISGSYDDTDTDFGDTVLYSGSRGAEVPGGGGGEAVLTAASKSLMMSRTRRKPVRVLRSAKCQSTFAPSLGIRYDGLYDVLDYRQESTEKGKRYWQFTLRRQSGQAPIDKSRPNLAERREFARMTQNH